MVLLLVLLVANQKQKSQAQSAVAKTQRAFVGGNQAGSFGYAPRFVLLCVGFLVRLATTGYYNHLFYHGGSALSLALALPENDEVALLQRELVSILLLRMLPRPEAIKYRMKSWRCLRMLMPGRPRHRDSVLRSSCHRPHAPFCGERRCAHQQRYAVPRLSSLPPKKYIQKTKSQEKNKLEGKIRKEAIANNPPSSPPILDDHLLLRVR